MLFRIVRFLIGILENIAIFLFITWGRSTVISGVIVQRKILGKLKSIFELFTVACKGLLSYCICGITILAGKVPKQGRVNVIRYVFEREITLASRAA